MRTSWIIIYSIVLHATWGAVLAVSGEQLQTTAIYTLSLFIPWPRVEGAALLLISAAALWSLRRETVPSMRSLLGVIPQQLILMASAFGALVCIAKSQFADGVIRPWTFILVDQSAIVLLAILHTAALVEHYVGLPFVDALRTYLEKLDEEER